MRTREFHFRRGTWSLGGEKVYLLAIMNVTPDSFSDGGAYNEDPVYQLEHATRVFEEGADGLDIGAESTRPGYVPITMDEEWRRLRPVLQALRARFPDRVISVDTQKSEIARRALEDGADIINDIWGFSQDPGMVEAIGAAGAGAIMMFNQAFTENTVTVEEVKSFFRQKMGAASRYGISPSAILVDPGIGFRIQGESSWTMLHHLKDLADIGAGVLVGHSRKRFLGTVSGESRAAERDVATAMLSGFLATSGADVLRVHNPGFSRQAIHVARKWTDNSG